MDINEVTILGTIKEITNILTLKNGQKCCWLNIETDVSFQKKDGVLGHNLVYHRVIAYGKYANVIKDKTSVDQKIFIQGRLKTNSWVHNGLSFQKTFIVLERFKIQANIQTKDKDPEYYDQTQDLLDEDNDWIELSNQDDEINHENDENVEEYDDLVSSLERLAETGWYYNDSDAEEPK